MTDDSEYLAHDANLGDDVDLRTLSDADLLGWWDASAAAGDVTVNRCVRTLLISRGVPGCWDTP